MTSAEQESQNIQTVFTLDMCGTNTIELTMIMTTHLQNLCKAINLTSFIQTLLIIQRVPSYTIEKDKDSNHGETCIIKFHAGLPYEDIAFRIVNDDWDYSHKNGFKCTFEGGILHLYFNFKRLVYRR